MLGLLLLTVLGTGADVITVDDDGPADFASIVDAVAAAQPGDLLRVAPGFYLPFTLEKRLTILGEGGVKPIIIQQSRVLHAPAATLAGLRFEALLVSGVNGLMRLDDCEFATYGGSDPNGAAAPLAVVGCKQLLVTRCAIDGDNPSSFGNSPGLTLKDSTASITSSSIHGADQPGSPPGVCGYDGKPAVSITNGVARFTATTMHGGKGGITGCFSAPSDGWSESGIESSGAVVDVRSGCVVAAGSYSQGFGGQYAALSASGGTIVLGGGTIGAGGLSVSLGTQVITTTPAEPTLLVEPDGATVPGATGQLLLSAPATAAGLLFVSLEGGLTNVPGVDGPLWVKLPVPAILSLAPGTTSLPWALPDDEALIGTVITLQAVYPAVPGALQPSKASLTAPDQIIVRF